jgi:ABC-type glycerol-3-phosphate transport system permease component
MVSSKLTKRLDFITTHLILLAFVAFALFPVLYTLMTSFKSSGDVLTRPPTFFPITPVLQDGTVVLKGTFTLEGYDVVLHESNMLRHYIPNSLINSITSSLLVVLLASLASYTFSRYKFRGSRVLELLILGLMMIPGLTNLLPLYRMASDLDLLNTHVYMIAIYTAGGLPFAIWIIRSFFDSIPQEMEEAALIDGCTPVTALIYVIMPIAIPGLLAAFLLMFVDTWNEFLAALVMLSGTNRTATVGLADFQSSFEIAYHVWTAACIIIMIPVLILFLLLRRRFFDAMLQGAVKG